jgi:hypothetical protein
MRGNLAASLGALFRAKPSPNTQFGLRFAASKSHPKYLQS